RYKQDFRFAMMLLFGSLLLFVIFGFVVFRFVINDFYGALVNLAIVTGLSLVLAYAVHTESTDRAGVVFIFVNMLACAATTAMFGHTGLFWAYLVLWVNFLMARRRVALAANLLLILGLFLQASLFNDRHEAVTFLVTSLLVTVFSLVFVDRLNRQQQQLEQLAMQDPLTQIGNRRIMQQHLENAMAEHRRHQTPATLVLIDLDHFKQINDEQGHEAGDEILIRFADLMRQSIRQGDGFYRYGGEEFVLLLPGHDQHSGLHVAELMHQRVSGKIEREAWTLRFSAGVASLLSGESWGDWLVRSDQALYLAKHGGRDRVVLWDDSMQSVRSSFAIKSDKSLMPEPHLPIRFD
ncbi:MAG: GGDEF domain-containing protein, partial [Pseudomonadota bacterium]